MRRASSTILGDTRGRPVLFRRWLKSHFCATSVRCHRRIVSGVTRVQISPSALRPRSLPLTAKRRRWSSVRRMRLLPCACLRTWFSVRRYSMTSCCCRLIQPARAIRRSCQGCRTKFMVARCSFAKRESIWDQVWLVNRGRRGVSQPQRSSRVSARRSILTLRGALQRTPARARRLRAYSLVSSASRFAATGFGARATPLRYWRMAASTSPI